MAGTTYGPDSNNPAYNPFGATRGVSPYNPSYNPWVGATPKPKPPPPVGMNPVAGQFTPIANLYRQYQTRDQYGNPMLTSAGGPSVASGSPAVTAGTFTNTPQPQTGTGAFGLVPGPIGIPSPFADISAIYPGLEGQNAALSQNISDELAGKLSPDTDANLRNMAATFGTTTGMPGSDFSNRFGLYNTALATQALKERGAQDYQKLLPTIFATQTAGPQLEAQIAAQNAFNAAAPNPDARAWYQRFAPNQAVSATSGAPNADANTAIGAAGAGVSAIASLAPLLAALL